MFDTAYVHGLDFADDGRSVVPIDVDGDGDLDLALLSLQRLYLLENRSAPANFVRLRLKATASDHQALGAIVSVRTGTTVQRDFVKATDGFQSQVPLELHFGLATSEVVDSVRVDWPSGASQEWTKLAAGKRHSLTEGEEEVLTDDVPRWPRGSIPESLPGAEVGIEATTLAGERAPLGRTGRPVVVNFWAPWCAPCLEELPELARLAQELESVDFVGVSVEREDLDSVRGFISRFGLTYPQFVADDALLTQFFAEPGAAALPSTFVFDSSGALRRIFRRPIGAKELELLLASFTDEGGFAAYLVRQAKAHGVRGELDEAHDCFKRALEIEPDYVEGLVEYGIFFGQRGETEDARPLFERAVELDPENHVPHWNLGITLLNLEKPKEALLSFEEVRRIRGNELDLLVSLVDATRRDENYEKALEYATLATEEHPDAAVAWHLRAVALFVLMHFDESRVSVEKALALDPKFEKSHVLSGQLKSLGH